MTLRSHRDLGVWQRAVELTASVYALCGKFPRSETYRLVDQMTRAATSVPANIAEGNARGTRKDYAHFIAIARGSLMELDTHFVVVQRLGFADANDVAALADEVHQLDKMLTVLRSQITCASGGLATATP
jgi:four helix bundle protein